MKCVKTISSSSNSNKTLPTKHQTAICCWLIGTNIVKHHLAKQFIWRFTLYAALPLRHVFKRLNRTSYLTLSYWWWLIGKQCYQKLWMGNTFKNYNIFSYFALIDIYDLHNDFANIIFYSIFFSALLCFSQTNPMAVKSIFHCDLFLPRSLNVCH